MLSRRTCRLSVTVRRTRPWEVGHSLLRSGLSVTPGQQFVEPCDLVVGDAAENVGQPDLPLQSRLRDLRGHPRCRLRGLEQPRRPALAHHVHRASSTRVGLRDAPSEAGEKWTGHRKLAGNGEFSGVPGSRCAPLPAPWRRRPRPVAASRARGANGHAHGGARQPGWVGARRAEAWGALCTRARTRTREGPPERSTSEPAVPAAGQRGRLYRQRHQGGSRSGTGHLTRSRPQDSPPNAAAPQWEPRKPLGGTRKAPARSRGQLSSNQRRELN